MRARRAAASRTPRRRRPPARCRRHVGPEQPRTVPLGHREVDAAERLHLPVRLARPSGLHGEAGPRGPPRRRARPWRGGCRVPQSPLLRRSDDDPVRGTPGPYGGRARTTKAAGVPPSAAFGALSPQVAGQRGGTVARGVTRLVTNDPILDRPRASPRAPPCPNPYRTRGRPGPSAVVARLQLGADLAARVLDAVDVDVGDAGVDGVEQLAELARGDALLGRADHVSGLDDALDRPLP